MPATRWQQRRVRARHTHLRQGTGIKLLERRRHRLLAVHGCRRQEAGGLLPEVLQSSHLQEGSREGVGAPPAGMQRDTRAGTGPRLPACCSS